MSWRDPQVKKKSPEAPAGDRMSPGVTTRQRAGTIRQRRDLTPLAHAGVARAQSNIGACFSEGLGVVRDATLAERWLQLSCRGRRSGRTAQSGDALFQGDGVDQDNARAAALYRAQPPNKAMSRCRTC